MPHKKTHTHHTSLHTQVSPPDHRTIQFRCTKSQSKSGMFIFVHFSLRERTKNLKKESRDEQSNTSPSKWMSNTIPIIFKKINLSDFIRHQNSIHTKQATQRHHTDSPYRLCARTTHIPTTGIERSKSVYRRAYEHVGLRFDLDQNAVFVVLSCEKDPCRYTNLCIP